MYLFIDGVSLRVRQLAGRKQVQVLVAYGIRQDGSRHLLALLRSQGEGQEDWEALLQDLYRRGLTRTNFLNSDGNVDPWGKRRPSLPSRVTEPCQLWRSKR